MAILRIKRAFNPDKPRLEDSKFSRFNYRLAATIKESSPKLWDAGGNIRGNEAFVLWGRYRDGDRSDAVLSWVKEREAWAARHFEDGRQLANGASPTLSSVKGVVAQMKWGVVGVLGRSKMEQVLRSLMDKGINANIGDVVEFDGVKGVVDDIVFSEDKEPLYKVKLAIPDSDGVLVETDCVADTSIVTSSSAKIGRVAKVKFFEESIPINCQSKAVTSVKDGDETVVDYQDVSVSGFASTFKNITQADRDGDYIEDDAFDKTITNFMRNPVMLTDHSNRVHSLAGSFSKILRTNKGLLVEGSISNAPDMQSVRYKVAEGHLRAFSIGGWFLYGEPNQIVEVNLLEISMVPIPANPDALFTSRSLSLEDCKKAYKRAKIWSETDR